jgi:hypothetical protein
VNPAGAATASVTAATESTFPRVEAKPFKSVGPFN